MTRRRRLLTTASLSVGTALLIAGLCLFGGGDTGLAVSGTPSKSKSDLATT